MMLLSKCEELIMMCIWNTDKPLNCVELEAILRIKYKKTWRLQTICTFLTRLQSKNYIYSSKDGRYTYYYPIISKADYQQFVVRNLLSNVFDNSSQELLETMMKVVESEEKNG